ncbi:MAG TPA: tRNA uridine-5-carboxymethylaminomethyl(34) synthesis enzyme MnmG [Candidatus Azoamicus sp.]
MFLHFYYFDVIVVGAGHAGIEAAYASCRLGVSVLLLTNRLDSVGDLACNPSIGGVGKGHLVKEIDAMGGAIAQFADISGINFKVLNSSKGYAVQSTRIQVDRNLYKNAVNSFLSRLSDLNILQQNVIDVILKESSIVGVITDTGLKFYSKAVIFTVGTFLGGKIFIGNSFTYGGRIGDMSAVKLSDKFKEIFPAMGRLKTGTPPRIDIRSVCLNYCSVQKSDIPVPFFSVWTKINRKIEHADCYVIYTNFDTHDVISKNINLSAIYNGSINVVGPRYCPSIEDKIIRFKDKMHHQVFLEPEGLNSYEFYPNGLSSSLPLDIQINFLKTIKGFNLVKVTRPGYAVEYDFFDPRILKNSLETKTINGLFFAGQINGSTGYEEAAAQGIIAGINAARFVLNLEPWVSSRNDSYIGVLIDDLISHGVDEPYRIFTSRAEYRLLLREDNVDIRLVEKARKFGLISDYKWQLYNKKIAKSNMCLSFIRKNFFKTFSNKKYLMFDFYNIFINKDSKFIELLKNQFLDFRILKNSFSLNFDSTVLKIIEIGVKYSGYLDKQNNEIKKIEKIKNLKIPSVINYFSISGLSMEIAEKLNLIKPLTLYHAYKIPGMTLSSVLILLVYIKKN